MAALSMQVNNNQNTVEFGSENNNNSIENKSSRIVLTLNNHKQSTNTMPCHANIKITKFIIEKQIIIYKFIS